MKSIRYRISIQFTATITGLLVCLFVAGHILLERHLIHQLDNLIEAQFKHLRSTLGPDYVQLTPATIDERIRDATESGSVLFYIDMHGPMTNRFFRSHNLHGQSIPDIPGLRTYNVELTEFGDLRVGEFLLKPFDVMVASPMAPVHEVMNGYRKIFFTLLVFAILISIGISFGLSKMVLQPIRLIQETANRIRSDNLKERIPVNDVKDEISQLAMFLNQMFDRLETSFFEIRRFAAEASHELKTPLSLVRLHGEALLNQSNLNAKQNESIQIQLEELSRINIIIDELLFLSRADARAIKVNFTQQDPAPFLRTFSQDAIALAEHHDLQFELVIQGEGQVRFEALRLRQVLLNLLSNAIHVSPLKTTIRLTSKLEKKVWRLTVDDEGPGLLPEQREKMFDRFVRYHTPSNGTDLGSGLGLAISRSIIKLHNGEIHAESVPDAPGLRIVIEIPR